MITCGEDASYCVWSPKTMNKNEKGNVERTISLKKKSGKNAYKSV